MRVVVDEPGRHQGPAGVEHALAVRPQALADLGDAAVPNPHVGALGGPARPVDHGAARHQQVSHEDP